MGQVFMGENEDGQIGEYIPSEGELEILKDLYICKGKKMTNPGVIGISERTGLEMEEVSGSMQYLVDNGLVSEYQGRRKRSKKTYSITEKGESFLAMEKPETLEIESREFPLNDADMAILETAAKSKYNGAVTPKYTSQKIGEDYHYTIKRLDRLSRTRPKLMKHRVEHKGGRRLDIYTITDDGRKRLKKARQNLAARKLKTKKPGAG